MGAGKGGSGRRLVMSKLPLVLAAACMLTAVALLGGREAQAEHGEEAYKCYRARAVLSKDSPRETDIFDQFQEEVFRVGDATALCNPALKTPKEDAPFAVAGGGQNDGPLLCREIRQVSGRKFGRERITVANQFGKQELILRSAKTICTSADKCQVPCAENFNQTAGWKCYRAKTPASVLAPPPDGFYLEDQFGRKQTEVERVVAFCTRVPVIRPEGAFGQAASGPIHLTCYGLDQSLGGEFLEKAYQVKDFFGTVQLELLGDSDARPNPTKCAFSQKVGED
jgi:hypothetical protein